MRRIERNRLVWNDESGSKEEKSKADSIMRLADILSIRLSCASF